MVSVSGCHGYPKILSQRRRERGEGRERREREVKRIGMPQSPEKFYRRGAESAEREEREKESEGKRIGMPQLP